ncbi:MAG: DNA polymerase III subunit gamma/tau C-terminal domain-containing protein, partial [Oceanobacter sp.]
LDLVTALEQLKPVNMESPGETPKEKDQKKNRLISESEADLNDSPADEVVTDSAVDSADVQASVPEHEPQTTETFHSGAVHSDTSLNEAISVDGSGAQSVDEDEYSEHFQPPADDFYPAEAFDDSAFSLETESESATQPEHSPDSTQSEEPQGSPFKSSLEALKSGEAPVVQTTDMAQDVIPEPAVAPVPDRPSLASRLASEQQVMSGRPETDQDQAASVGEQGNEATGDMPSESLPELAPHTWWQWVERLSLAGLPMAIAKNSALVSIEGNLYRFEIDPAQGALFNPGQQSRIEQALQERLPECRIEMTLCPPSGETPNQRRERLIAEAHAAARQSIEQDGQVQNILGSFNATLVADTIRPVS